MKLKVNKRNVGLRIRQIRNSLNLTLEEFGKIFSSDVNNKLNAGKSNVSTWERGDSLPNKQRLDIIAKKGNMTVNELLYGSIDEFLDNNLVSILEYQTGNKVSSNEEYSIARLQFKKWLEDRHITLENINCIYDYIDQNNASWNPWNIDTDYLKTMENIRINMQDGTYSLVPLIEMLTDKDRERVSKYILKILKTYQFSESDKRYINEIEKSFTLK
ncbi:MAG: hypothetical protein HXM18_01160 [Gemella morbillorum]|uniref:helix-turn-helix domain-containing protein n=1 Tax=Gemella morbillorum TaxID=29391 RepID=UPI001CADFD1D|nr:hypothetical protein [Gemella morbillorum]MBF1209123.1 hypothetical protein [Gemella morbillorum]